MGEKSVIGKTTADSNTFLKFPFFSHSISFNPPCNSHFSRHFFISLYKRDFSIDFPFFIPSPTLCLNLKKKMDIRIRTLEKIKKRLIFNNVRQKIVDKNRCIK